MPRPLSAQARLPADLLLAALGGFALGMSGSFLQAVDQRGLPVGTVVVLVVTGLAFFGAGALCRSRVIAAACAAGWALAVVFMITPRAAGDVVLTAVPRTYVFLAGGLLLACAAGCWPYGLVRRGADASDMATAEGKARERTSLRRHTR